MSDIERFQKIANNLGEYVNGTSQWIPTDLFTRLINYRDRTDIPADDIQEIPTNRPIIVIPVHREHEIPTLPDSSSGIVVLNDNYQMDVQRAVMKYPKSLIELLKAIEIEDTDHRTSSLLISPYEGNRNPEDLPDLIKRNGVYYNILGQVLKNEDGDYTVFKFNEDPGSYFHDVDAAQTGKYLNDRMLTTLPKQLPTIIPIDLVGKTFAGHLPHSIGRARGIPIQKLLEQRKKLSVDEKESLDTLPIYWLDADSCYEDGAFETAEYIYANNKDIQAVFFLQRVELSANVLPVDYTNHALTQLDRVLDFLNHNIGDKPVIIGGPQISSRLNVYSRDYKVVFQNSTYDIDLCQSVMRCDKNEDFLFSYFLQHALEKPDLIMLPNTVIVKPRFSERSDLTALAGDSQMRHYVFPSWRGDYNLLYQRLNTRLGLNTPASRVDEHNFIDTFRGILTTEQTNILDRFIEIEESLFDRESMDIDSYELGIFINALQRLILNNNLKNVNIAPL